MSQPLTIRSTRCWVSEMCRFKAVSEVNESTNPRMWAILFTFTVICGCNWVGEGVRRVLKFSSEMNFWKEAMPYSLPNLILMISQSIMLLCVSTSLLVASSPLRLSLMNLPMPASKSKGTSSIYCSNLFKKSNNACMFSTTTFCSEAPRSIPRDSSDEGMNEDKYELNKVKVVGMKILGIYSGESL